MVNMEEDIDLELTKLSLPDSESPTEDVEEDYGSFTVIEEFPESVLSFLQSVKQRSENAEKLILEDLDSTDTWTSEYFPVPYNHQPTDNSDYFAQLASENNEDPETFKKRVLADIEEDDRKDLLSCDHAEIEDNVDKSDGADEVLNFCYTKVEENCRQKLQQWEKEQEKCKEVNRAALNAQKAVLVQEIKEQEEKRENWEKEFEKELFKLSTFQQEQQENLESDLKRNYEALEQDLQHHQKQIDKIEADLIVERKAFEEQKANAQKRLEELQHKSAVTIQAAFRARQVYKVYAPILMQKKEDLKRKQELQQKMDREKKEQERKIKMKLEEKRRKDEEKKQNEEIAKKKIDEAKRKEYLEQEKRHREYERKKVEEKMRLEKAKLLKQEETSKQEMNSPIYSSRNGKPAKEGEPKEEPSHTLKMAEDKEERQEMNSPIYSSRNGKPAKEGEPKEEPSHTLKMAEHKEERQEMNSPIYSSRNGKPAKEGEPKEEPSHTLKMAEDKEERQEKNNPTYSSRNGKPAKEGEPKEEPSHTLKMAEDKEEREERNNPTYSSRNEKNAKEGEPKEEPSHTLKMAEDKEERQEKNNPTYSSRNGKTAKEGEPKEEPSHALKIKEKEERQEKNRWIQQEIDVGLLVNTSGENIILQSTADVEPAVCGASEIVDGSSLLVYNKKSIERESPSPMTALPVTSTEGHILSPPSAVNHMEEKDTSQITGNSQSQTPLSSVAVNGGALSDQAEAKRLAWMKSCKPWAKILRDNQKVVVKKARQRKSFAAKQLPPLKEALILHNTPWQYLQQVTAVTLHDLPGCSLSTLSKCVDLRFLSLRRCQLSALDGLRNCKALQYIDVQENCISFINCEGLENLGVLLLNKNHITSIHGIEDCKNLMTLELSFNSITRIAGLESLRSLQWLALDHNQLISTKALETTPQLTYLDCSHNYLTELEGIQNCGLLQILKLQGNNLSEIPRLDSHILMRELYLDDNNLTTMTDLSSYWLPLLQVFSVSQNSITHLVPFHTFISLEDLNLSSNCLSELETVTLWLEGCMNLRKLSISKNPFLQEHNWRFTLQKTLPALRSLNDEEITSEDTQFHKSPAGSFTAFCQHQISNIRKLWHVVNDQERQSLSLEKLDIYCNSLKEILQLSIGYRYAHEYGDTDVAEREDPEIQLHLENSQHSSHIIVGPHEDKWKDTKQITLQHAQSFVNAEQSDPANSRGSTKYQPQLSEISTRKDIKEHSRKVCAAVLIQSQWRGYVVRRDIHYYTKLHEAASLIQSAWHYYYRRKKSLHKKCANPRTLEVKEQAATVIQAAWKGFFLRKKLAAAFDGIDREELGDDFEEVNLDEFTFDENVFEKDWSVDPALSHSGALHIFSKPDRPKKNVIEDDREYSLPWFPQEAWAVSEGSALDRKHRYEKDSHSGRSEKQNLSHVSSMKSNTDISFKSEKEEKISQEWGFKEASTAQLMLKRAQKMKSKQAKHKKMLDPAVRLALFKNNENKHAPVMPPKKAQPTKTEYFRGKEEELCHLKELPSEALARSRELTYQWLHTQCGNINTTSPAISKSKGFLPELNHGVLNGGRVQLVAKEPLSKEADDIDLMSLKSVSTLSQNREEKVRTQRSSGTLSNTNVFAPVKTNIGPQRKERISFRDNPAQLSGGWGGGKKKGKAVQ